MRIVYFFALSLFLNAGLALAQSGPAVLTILPGWQTESGTNLAAFEISLEPGWKTYWRAPGDSGIPPRVDWKGSTNVGAVEFHWPRPGIFDELGTRTVGYKDRLVLPVEFTPKNPGKPITAAGELEIGVCLDVCVPMSFRFSAELPQAGSPDRQIQNALAQKAEQVAGDGIPGLGCVFDPISDGLRVEARFDNSPLKDPKAAIFER